MAEKTRWDFNDDEWDALPESEQARIEELTVRRELAGLSASQEAAREAGQSAAEEAAIERELQKRRIRARVANALALTPSLGTADVPGASWMPAVTSYLETETEAPDGKTYRRTNVSTAELWTVALGQPAGTLRSNMKTLNDLLRAVPGWSHSGRVYGFPTGRAYGFVRDSASREAMTARFEVVVPGLSAEDMALLG